MCIVLMQLDHPDFAFLVANNRDEFLARPTAPSHWHNFPSPSEFVRGNGHTPSLSSSKDGEVGTSGALEGTSASLPSPTRPVLCGIDVHANGGGTWIGITRTGRFAALTNFTEPSAPPLPQGRGLKVYRSRGKLPRDWLLGDGDCTLQSYLEGIAERMDEWPGFNLLCGNILSGVGERDGARIGYVSNRTPQGGVSYLNREGDETGSRSGCTSVGLSNSILAEPWVKVTNGTGGMDKALSAYDAARQGGLSQVDAEDALKSDLFKLLTTTPYSSSDDLDVNNLPKSILIPPFKRNEQLGWYATRTATVMLVRRGSNTEAGHVMRWWERDIHIVNEHGEVERCDSDSQRYYAAEICIQ